MPIGKITAYPQVRVSLKDLPEADQHAAERKMQVSVETKNTAKSGEQHAVVQIERSEEDSTKSTEQQRSASVTVRSESVESGKTSAAKPGRLSYTAAALEERIFQEIKEHEAREKELLFIRQLSSTSSPKDSKNDSGSITPIIISPVHNVEEISTTTKATTIVSVNPTIEIRTSDNIKIENGFEVSNNVNIDKSISTKEIKVVKSSDVNNNEIKLNKEHNEKADIQQHFVEKPERVDKLDNINVTIKDKFEKEIVLDIINKDINISKNIDISLEKSINIEKSTNEVSSIKTKDVEIESEEKHQKEFSKEIIIIKQDKQPDETEAKSNQKNKMIDNVKAKVQPLEDYESIQEDKAVFKPLRESTIDLEVRVAREREQDLKQSRGQNSATINGGGWKSQHNDETIVVVTPVINRSAGEASINLSQDDDAFKKMSENRFKAELQREKEREINLLKEGKIKSLSMMEKAQLTSDQNIKSELESELAQLKELNKTKKIKMEVENFGAHPSLNTGHVDFRLEKEVEEVNKREQELRSLKESINKNRSSTVTVTKSSTRINIENKTSSEIKANEIQKDDKDDNKQVNVVIVTKEDKLADKSKEIAGSIVITKESTNNKTILISTDKSDIKASELDMNNEKGVVVIEKNKNDQQGSSKNIAVRDVDILKKDAEKKNVIAVDIVKIETKNENNIKSIEMKKSDEAKLNVETINVNLTKNNTSNGKEENSQAMVQTNKVEQNSNIKKTNSADAATIQATKRRIGKLSIIEKWEKVNQDGPPVLSFPE